jgi:inner membrane transporter RhtA
MSDGSTSDHPGKPPAASTHSAPTAVFSTVVAMLSFQLGATFAKQLIPVVGSLGTTALRLGLSALLVIALQRPWRTVPSRSAWPIVLAYGVALGAMNSVFYLALRTIPLGIAVAIEFIGPLAVAVFASRRKLDYLWVALAGLGLALLLPITGGATHLDTAGVLYALAAGVGWALYIVFGQKAGHAQGASASTWGMMIAAVVTVPIGIADAGIQQLAAPGVLAFGLGVAVFSSALPYTLEMVALRRLSAKTFGTLMSFEPAIAALAGVTLLHEHLTGLQWLAIAAIVGASMGAVAGEPGRAERADFAP